jgi:hypothetical protein
MNMANSEAEGKPGYPLQLPGRQQPEKNQQSLLSENTFQQNPSLMNPQRAPQVANYPKNPTQQHPQNNPLSGNIGNQMQGGIRNMYHNPPPTSFPQMAPGNERPHFGGHTNDRPHFGGPKPQAVPPQLQNPASQFHLLNQLLGMNAGMGMMNVRPALNMQSSMEQQGKKEEFPFVPPELLGALSQLAIQVSGQS